LTAAKFLDVENRRVGFHWLVRGEWKPIRLGPADCEVCDREMIPIDQRVKTLISLISRICQSHIEPLDGELTSVS